MLLSIPGELSVLVECRTSQTERFRDDCHRPRSCFPTIYGLSVSRGATQQRDPLQFTFISTKHSADLHKNASFSSIHKPLQIVIIRQYHQVVNVVKHSDVLADVIALARIGFAVSRVPYMLLRNRPHQPALSLSGGNSTNTHLLDGEWK